MTTELEPTTLSRRDDLERQLLTALMARDAKVHADRTQGIDSLSTPVPLHAGSVRIRRIADALGCPKGVQPAAFLLELGYLTQVDGGGYTFVRKYQPPRVAEKAKRKSRARPGAEEHREAEAMS